jgi:hypothetical protein
MIKIYMYEIFIKKPIVLYNWYKLIKGEIEIHKYKKRTLLVLQMRKLKPREGNDSSLSVISKKIQIRTDHTKSA